MRENEWIDGLRENVRRAQERKYTPIWSSGWSSVLSMSVLSMIASAAQSIYRLLYQ